MRTGHRLGTCSRRQLWRVCAAHYIHARTADSRSRMDQAASVFSLRGTALYVSFKPNLEYKTLEFPHTDPELTFITAQSFVAADKHVTAPECYNLRVVECTLAAVFLAKAFGLKSELPTDSSPLGASLRGFHDTYYEEKRSISDNTKTSSTNLKLN